MTIENLRDGLSILIANGSEGYCVAAEHDILCAGAPKKKLPKKARRDLEALGWHWDESNEPWSAFT